VFKLNVSAFSRKELFKQVAKIEDEVATRAVGMLVPGAEVEEVATEGRKLESDRVVMRATRDFPPSFECKLLQLHCQYKPAEWLQQPQ
jgi:hypothetical protein